MSRILTSLPEPVISDQTPTLVLTYGLPGSGKSTFCRRVAAETGVIVLESDALRRLLFTQPTHEPAESKRLFAALWQAARVLLQAGASVIVDATNLKPADRQPAFELAEQTGATLLLLRFEAPLSLVEQRLTRRLTEPNPTDNSTAGIEVYRLMRETAVPLRDPHWTIDTSDFEATEAALRAVITALRGANPPRDTEISNRSLVGLAGGLKGATRTGGTVS